VTGPITQLGEYTRGLKACSTVYIVWSTQSASAVLCGVQVCDGLLNNAPDCNKATVLRSTSTHQDRFPTTNWTFGLVDQGSI
jgi:hypothetical protein